MADIKISQRAKDVARLAVEVHGDPEAADEYLQQRWQHDRDDDLLGALAWVRRVHPKQTTSERRLEEGS